MKILVIGGTRFMGKHLVDELLRAGHEVTIANRGRAQDDFGGRVGRIVFERTDEESIKRNLAPLPFDLVYDSLAYCSNDIRRLLDHLRCKRYIMLSSTAVYDKHLDTKEEEFDPLTQKLVWCDRSDFSYQESKRQAEIALAQKYPNIEAVAVRFPFVIGPDDYTQRLYFYVEHIMRQKSMHVDNYDSQMGFIRSDEAGRFLSFFAENRFSGAINGASEGTVSIKEIAEYVAAKTGNEIIMSFEGEEAPYNGEKEYSIHTGRAKSLGFCFSSLKDWIYGLLDDYIDRVQALDR